MSARVIYNPVIMRRQQQQQDRGGVDPERSKVRRNLFGPVDNEENLRFAQEELSRIQNADSIRWNFDFEKEFPLQGRYDWEVVTGEIPSAYDCSRMPYLRQHADSIRVSNKSTKTIISPLAKVSLDSNKIQVLQTTPLGQTNSNRSDNYEAGPLCAGDSQTTGQKPSPARNADAEPKTEKQTKITDYMKPRKKASTTVMVSAAKRRRST